MPGSSYAGAYHSAARAAAAAAAGDQPTLTPRRLSVINTSSNSVIRDLSFSSSVLAVRLNKQR
jgi:autophagy-related protein 18